MSVTAAQVEQLLLGVPIPSVENIDILAWAPDDLVAEARQLLIGLKRLARPERARRLALAAGKLMGAARSAYWPLAVRGELDVSADEKPAVVLYEMDLQLDPTWLRGSLRAAIRELRQATEALLRRAEVLAGNNPDTVSFGEVDRVTYSAIDLAVRVAVLALRHDPSLRELSDYRAIAPRGGSRSVDMESPLLRRSR